MGKFLIQFEDPSKELTGGESLKPNWNPLSRGSISISDGECNIYGTSRLSIAENFFSLGILGQILIKSFFESIRSGVYNFTSGEIVKIVGVTEDKTTKLSKVTVFSHDQVGIFLQKSDKTREFLSFSFYANGKIRSRTAFWLFWGQAAGIIPTNKLELRSDDLRKEIGLPSATESSDVALQTQICTAFFTSLHMTEATTADYVELAKSYQELGTIGAIEARKNLAATDGSTRAAAALCLGYFRQIDDLNALLPLLHDSIPLVRACTAISLGQYPASNVGDHLRGVRTDPDKMVTSAAEDALKQLK
jgi:hypothetical protein